MTGPEHYREAERLLDRVDSDDLAQQAKALRVSADAYATVLAQTIAKADVHATLAQAAATALNVPIPNYAEPAELVAWRGVTR